MAECIEVLRGPFSALYGNHSGGMVQLFTRDPKGPPSIETSVSAGCYGMRKLDVNAQDEANGIGYLIDGSRFDTDGFGDHGAARRDQAYAKLTMATSAAGRIVLTASGLRQDDTQNPLGVSWATYQRDPRAGEIDTTDPVSPQRTLAERYNTRKGIDHKQFGLTWEQRFGANRLQVTADGGNRRVVQYQSFSRGFQAPPTDSGGVGDFARLPRVDVNQREDATLAAARCAPPSASTPAARPIRARVSRISPVTCSACAGACGSACAGACAATKRTKSATSPPTCRRNGSAANGSSPAACAAARAHRGPRPDGVRKIAGAGGAGAPEQDVVAVHRAVERGAETGTALPTAHARFDRARDHLF